MHKSLLKFGVSAIALLAAQAAYAESLPAVSGINGRLEISAGAMSLPQSGIGHITGTLTAPLGDQFGVQFDGHLDASVMTSGGGAVHLFTRDPSSYLIGVTGAAGRSTLGTIAGIGAEAELYLGDVSIEAWAGFAGLNYDAPAAVDRTGAFAVVDLAYYAGDDFRFNVGASSVLGYEAAHIGAEYQFSGLDTPFSLKGRVQLGEDGAVTAKAGVLFYFGGNGNSLKERHRQDDPLPRSFDLFGGAGSSNGIPPTTPAPPVVVVAE